MIKNHQKIVPNAISTTHKVWTSIFYHFSDNLYRFGLQNPSKITQKSFPEVLQSVTGGSRKCLRSALDQFGWAWRCPEVLSDRFWLDFYLFLVGYGFDFAYILGLSWLESSALRAYMNHECGWPRRSHSHVCTVQRTNTQANVYGISNESLTVRSDVGLMVPIFWESWQFEVMLGSWFPFPGSLDSGTSIHFHGFRMRG